MREWAKDWHKRTMRVTQQHLGPCWRWQNMDYCMNRERFCLAWNTHVNPFLFFHLPPNSNQRRKRCRDRLFLGLSHLYWHQNHRHGPRHVFPIHQSIIHFPSSTASPCSSIYLTFTSFFFPNNTLLSFIHMIMKSSRILLLCLLTTAFYLLHQHSSIASTSSSSLNFLPGRRHVRELSMSFSNRKNEYQEIQVSLWKWYKSLAHPSLL